MQKIRILGGASDVCRPCAISGHDGDSCRANKLEDGGVFCVTCASVSRPIADNARAIYQMPMSVKLVVAELLRSDPSQYQSQSQSLTPLTATYAEYGPGELSGERAAAAVAQGNVDTVLGSGRVNFATDALAHVVVRFQYEEVKNYDRNAFAKKEVSAAGESLLTLLNQRSCPPTLVAATRKLLEIGFVVLASDLDPLMRRVALCHTLGADFNQRNPRGIFAEINYVV